MRIISKTGDPRFAEVYVAQVRNNPKALIEFVDACDPRYPKKEKWIIIVSTQIGCPVGCLMCDSGAYFLGNLTKDEILAQVDYIINPPVTTPLKKGGMGWLLFNHPKLKIQFARMGEPALNPSVLDVLKELPARYPIKGLMPCIATVAPYGANEWFERLIDIKNRYYSNGRFQLQFSINSTNEDERDKVMPIKKWRLADIAGYGERYYNNGDRKITLNFALAKDGQIDLKILQKIFNPEQFLIKITPINSTFEAKTNFLSGIISPDAPNGADDIKMELTKIGFETIISIGSVEEILIGSNCGQTARKEHYVRHNYNTSNLEWGQKL